MRILRYDGDTALVEVYLAPGVVSDDIVAALRERVELMLAGLEGNAFVKRVYRDRDYFAVIVLENRGFQEVLSVSASIENKTRRAASRVKSSITSAIRHL